MSEERGFGTPTVAGGPNVMIEHGTDLQRSSLGGWEPGGTWEAHTDVSYIEDEKMSIPSENSQAHD